MKLNFSFKNLPVKYIQDKNDFYKSGLKETSKIRNLCNVIQRLFITNSNKIDLFILGDKSIYRLDIYDTSVKKKLISQIYYLPDEYRLDLYDSSNLDVPLYVWINKRIEYTSALNLFSIIKTEQLFIPLISIL